MTQSSTQTLKFNIPLILFALVLASGLGFLFAKWQAVSSIDKILADMSSEQLQQQKLTNDLTRIDENLIIYAQMAIHSRDPVWQEQFERTLPELYASLDEAALNAVNSPHANTVQGLRQAVDRLVAMQRNALYLLDQGQRDKALDIIEGELFAKEHLAFHDKLYALSGSLGEMTAIRFASAQKHIRAAWSITIVIVPVLTVTLLVLSLYLYHIFGAIRKRLYYEKRAKEEVGMLMDKAVAELSKSKTRLEEEVEVRKAVEENISASEKKYRGLVETSLAGFAILDETGKVIDANDRYVELTGRSSLEEVVGCSVLEWTAGYHKKKNIDAADELIAKGFIQNLQIDYIDGEGNTTPVEIHCTVVNDSGSNRLYSLVFDITERLKAEQTLRDSEIKYRRLIDTTDTAFVSVNTSGQVLDANAKYIKLTGHERLSEILGRSILEWTVDDQKADNADAIIQCHEQGWIRDFQVDYVRPDGSLVPVEINAATVTSEHGLEMHALCRDITTRRAAEKQLKEYTQQLKLAFRGGKVGIWDWNVPSGTVQYNEDWAAILGFGIDEIDHTYPFWESRLHPLDKERTIREVEAHIAGDVPAFEIEHRLETKDGDWKWVLGVGKIMETTSDGSPLRMTGVMIDIDQRKRAEEGLALSESRFRNMTLTSSDWIWQIDAEGKYTYASDTVARILGFKPEEMLGKTPLDFMPEDEAKRLKSVFEESLLKPFPLVDIENWNLTKSGKRICVLTNAVPIFEEFGEFAGYFGTDKDITGRKENEYQLKLFGKVFESALEGITITSADGKILAVNKAFTYITGYDPEEVLGQNPRVLKSDRHEANFYSDMWEELREQGQWEGEIWNRRKSGEAYPEWLSISTIQDDDGHISHYVAVFHDITEMKRKEEQIEHQAYHDALTGLPNRLLFKDRLTHVIKRAERSGVMAAVLFIDLDNFKVINDSLGHAVGDQMLLDVASRFQKEAQSSDTVARLGGDEFVILMDEVDGEEDAINLAERLILALEEPVFVEGRELFSTPSLGIAVYPRDGENAEELLKNADIAMYRAKEQGRNQYNLFTASMTAVAQRRLELERDLRHALVAREFFLCYQPKVSVKTGRVEGMEALVRWKKGDEVVSPLEFIHLAEKTGLISQLGQLVMDTALLECADILAAQELQLSVNLSPLQFQEPALVDILKATLEKHGVIPKRLEVEITETTLVDDAEDAIAKLESINQMGVSISMDDFGTGYSSLAYIKKLPVQTLKIDQSFVRGLGSDQGDESIIKTIIQLARNFEMTVVAEGVETKEQLEILRDFDCDLIQGYYYSKPVRIREFKEYVSKCNK